MARWNPNLYPKGGFVYTDDEKVVHVGGTLEELISRLASYRVRRGLPPGNPVAEVHGQLCQRFPDRCLNEPLPDASKPAEASGPLPGTRLVAWLRDLWLRASQKQIAFVTEEESAKRAAICRQCPHYKPMPTECAACAETFNHLSFQLRAGRDKFSKSLTMCDRFHTDLRVDTLVEQPDQPKAPENCWKRGSL
jgi:hypothetical protein